jgi:hypothetical protein
MDVVKVKWLPTNYGELREYYDTYYYALSRGNNLLYIGIGYHQNVQTEVRQTIRRLNINTQGLTIWLGYIDYEATTYQRITQQIVLDVECLMIFTNSPAYNTQCQENYTGRNNLKVRTSGCRLIRRCVRCQHHTVYLSC